MSTVFIVPSSRGHDRCGKVCNRHAAAEGTPVALPP